MTEAEVATIRALPAEKALRLHEAASAAKAALPVKESIRTDGDDTARVSAWLESLPLQASSVGLSWEPHVAVVVEWSLFTRYWDDFCYPSSDDMFACPPDWSWLIEYHHDEQLAWRAPIGEDG